MRRFYLVPMLFHMFVNKTWNTKAGLPTGQSLGPQILSGPLMKPLVTNCKTFVKAPFIKQNLIHFEENWACFQRIPEVSISTGRSRYSLMSVGYICFKKSHISKLYHGLTDLDSLLFAAWCLPPSLSVCWPRPQNRRKPSTVCSQARAVY